MTARRRAENLQNVPAVVNPVTAEQITKLNLREFKDIQQLVPGLQLKSEANGISGSGQMRGINYDANSGANYSVAFYLNDAPIEAGTLLQAMYDIGQIEVLRGPQGTLNGLASPSGAIKVTTKKPDLQDFGGYVQTSENDIGTVNVNGALGIPVIRDIAAIRVAGVFDRNQSNRVRTVETGVEPRSPYSSTVSGRVTGLVTPADWLKIDGMYQRQERNSYVFDQYESFPGVPTGSYGYISANDRLSIQETPRIINQKYDLFNWHAEAHFADQALIYTGSHGIQNIYSRTNQDSANFIKGRDIYQYTTLRAVGWSHELRLQSERPIGGLVDYVVGAFEQVQTAQSGVISETPVLLPTFLGGGLASVVQTPIVSDSHTRERSLFGNLTLHFGPATEVSGGLRYIHSFSEGGLTIFGSTLPNPTVDETGVIYTASVSHKFTPDLMVYASTGTSRRPSVNAIGDFSVSKSALQNSFQFLPSEKSTSYEIGIKSSWLDNRLQVNVTGYHQKFQNYPYRVSTPVYYVSYTATSATTSAANVGSFNFLGAVPVEVNGVEAEVDFKVTPRWNVGVVGSYSIGTIKNGLIPCNDLNGDGVPDTLNAPPSLPALQAAVGANNLSGCRVTQRASFQSPFSFTIQSEYSHPLSSNVDIFGRGLYSFNGDALNDPTNAYDQVKAYGLLNLFGGIRHPDGAWEIGFFVKNLFDVNRVLSRQLQAFTSFQRLNSDFATTTGGTASVPYSQITMTAPREFGINVRFAFGSR
ncbi:MAG TPA: TonB-dependent receptor [Sphingobium sp.]|uniref:TonB-dependent receptor n=1 Tax=Sphingobium sp. TaxID=1912891 RepID=UPI002ED49D66